MLNIENILHCKKWQDSFSKKELASLTQVSLLKAVECLPFALPKDSELSVQFIGAKKMQELNKRWRGKSGATNVLSFASNDGVAKENWSCVLGDIVLAYEVVEIQARKENKSFKNHVVHLLVHGFLHLVGFRHGTKAQARKMEQLEISILQKLNIGNPYEAQA